MCLDCLLDLYTRRLYRCFISSLRKTCDIKKFKEKMHRCAKSDQIIA